ncbi:clavesin-2 [Trichonephila clavata]|uniref:Clavesin-2 n=1 Tax=Trichonephila clavata TaxID=2740835 RepID=A0A8X6HI85_TRICU|nr:clavesin-2 [Trichonephila clavata]
MPTSSQFIRYDGTDLAPSALKEIQTRIGETEHAKKKGLDTLTKKLKGWSPLRAFERIKRYYGMQEDVIKIFCGNSISIPAVRSSEYFWALPYRNENNSAVAVARMGIPDFSKISFDDKCYLDLLFTDHILKNPLTQMCGVSFIVDWSGFKLSSFLAFRPLTIFKLFNHLLNSIPLRIKEIHVVNAHSVFRILYNVLHFIFPKELREKIFFHPNDDWKSLHGFISPQILSEEYGGNIKKSTMINLLENAEELEKQFLESFSYGYVDTKQKRMSFSVITK